MRSIRETQGPKVPLRPDLRDYSDKQSQLQVGLASRDIPRSPDAIERQYAQRQRERERNGHDDIVRQQGGQEPGSLGAGSLKKRIHDAVLEQKSEYCKNLKIGNSPNS